MRILDPTPAPADLDLTPLTDAAAREIDGGCFICDYLGDIIWPTGPVVCEDTVLR